MSCRQSDPRNRLSGGRASRLEETQESDKEPAEAHGPGFVAYMACKECRRPGNSSRGDGSPAGRKPTVSPYPLGFNSPSCTWVRNVCVPQSGMWLDYARPRRMVDVPNLPSPVAPRNPMAKSRIAGWLGQSCSAGGIPADGAEQSN